MNVARQVLYAAALLLAAFGPWIVRTQVVHRPHQEELAAELADRLAERERERETIREAATTVRGQRSALEQRLDELRDEQRDAAQALDTEMVGLDRVRRERASLEDRASTLEARVEEAETTCADLRARVHEQEATLVALRAEVGALAERRDALAAETLSRQESTRALVAERIAWENFQTFGSLPRVSLSAYAGVADEGNCGGVEVGMVMLRRFGQRWGLKGGLLVRDTNLRSEGAYAGPTWQLGLDGRAYVEMWAGPYWYTTPDGPGIDPALGGTLGWTFPSWRLGLGLTALTAPETSMVGLALGYSQIGEAIDPYW